MDKERDCYSCQHYQLCYRRRNLDRALAESGGLNANRHSHETPLTTTDVFAAVFAALAGACPQFLQTTTTKEK